MAAHYRSFWGGTQLSRQGSRIFNDQTVTYADGGYLGTGMAEMLLLSNSTALGGLSLPTRWGVIGAVLDGRRRVLFVALASGDPGRATPG
jgi:hypothetical protein